MAGKPASVLFLGSGSALAESGRFHASVLLQCGTDSVLVDAGDGAAYAFACAGVSTKVPRSVIITHFHPDHYTGIPALLQQMKFEHRTEPLLLCCGLSNVAYLKEFLRQSLIFGARLPFQVEVAGMVATAPITLPGGVCTVIPFSNAHLQKYSTEPDAAGIPLTAFSLLFTVAQRSLFYSSDVGSITDLKSLVLPPRSLLILDGTHLPVSEAGEWAAAADAARLIITHISSHSVPRPPPAGVTFAYDGLMVDW